MELAPFPGSTRLAELATHELEQLTRDADWIALPVLGVLTAAAGPLAVSDLAALSVAPDQPTAVHTARVRRLLTTDAARSVQLVGPPNARHYQFARGCAPVAIGST